MVTVAEQYEAFTQLAKTYCAAIESPSVRGKQGLRGIHDVLLLLHLAATQLPDVESTGDPGNRMEHGDWRKIQKDLQKRIPFDVYWDTYEPLTDPPEPIVAGSLTDDLADIWRDLKAGLVNLETGAEDVRPDVWWEWRFSFITHWGAHSADALRVMHYALRDS